MVDFGSSRGTDSLITCTASPFRGHPHSVMLKAVGVAEVSVIPISVTTVQLDGADSAVAICINDVFTVCISSLHLLGHRDSFRWCHQSSLGYRLGVLGIM
jgi:hypothetical protein